MLFLKRSGTGDRPGEWCLPGGTLEDGEEAADAATREAREEIGVLPYGERKPLAQTVLPLGVFGRRCKMRRLRPPVDRAGGSRC